MRRVSRQSKQDTSVRLPPDFEATIKALLNTTPPRAGDPSTRKQTPKKKPAKKGKADDLRIQISRRARLRADRRALSPTIRPTTVLGIIGWPTSRRSGYCDS